ncbi:MAG TPA: nucleoside triphosphate pyrophosphohydrolase [Spirochaetota bacterium]|nr:nucleoside triphosphate pyrophosphohydrolase [Spirochaetota bacterium]
MDSAASYFDDILAVIQKLRGSGGCPWDKKQNFFSMKNELLEEVYEFIDTLGENNTLHLREELGDLLFNVLFYAVMAEEKSLFTVRELLDELKNKLVYRHPHVFKNERVDTAAQALALWNRQKNREKKRQSILDGLAKSQPPMLKAYDLQKRAARCGFDWDNIKEVADKIEEELAELKTALESGNTEQTEAEAGDLLFSIINLCRFADIDPDKALTQTNKKFINRFKYMEADLNKEGAKPEQKKITELEQLWQKAKRFFP